MQLVRILFFDFIIYSFIGWLIEGFFNLATRGHFRKANFLSSPLKPMYGITATLLVSIHAQLPFSLFLLCAFFLPSFIEYLTAYLLHHHLNLMYWDYSHCPYNLSGYICLKFSFYWLILSLLLVYLLHPLILSFYETINWFWFGFFPICLLLFLTDFILTLRSKRQALPSKT